MILVTGPDGFVGSAVCLHLVRQGASVRGAQWSSVALPVGCSSVIVGDIGPRTDWSLALEGINSVVHLAGRVHIMLDTAKDPLTEFRRVNVEGTIRLAQTAAQAGVKRFVFLSSVKVNGETTEEARPFTEDCIPHPEDAYALSKWEAEKALREIERQMGIEVTIIRPPLIYGPGVKANFLNLIRLIDRGLPLPFGGIHNHRSFLSLANLGDLICCCLTHPEAARKTFLVSDGDDVSTPELVNRIALALGKRARLLNVPKSLLKLAGVATGKSLEIKRLCGSLQVDSSKVRKVLGWKSQCSMAEELARVAKWWHDDKQ